MADTYLTAFLIVIAVVTVYLVGGYLFLSKLRLIHPRKRVVVDSELVGLLKRFSLPESKERVVEHEDRPLIERYRPVGYLDFGLNSKFELTARTSKLGERLLNAYR